MMINTEPFNYNDHFSFDFTYNQSHQQFHTYHSHNHMEFLYIHEGKGRLLLNDRISEIEPGLLVIIQPFQFHGVNIKNAFYERAAIHFEPSIFESYFQPFPKLTAFYEQLWKGLLPQQCLLVSREYFLVLLADLHHDFMRMTGSKARLERMGIFLVTLCQHIQGSLIIGNQSTTTERDPVNHHIEKIIQWIERNYMNKFSLTDLARFLHLSPQYISTLFRQTTGSNLTDYLKQRRIRTACYLLASTSLSIDEISYRVGYTNTSHFCELFKKEIGLTPLQYRKKPILSHKVQSNT